jgi:hypothetical protein
MVEAGERGLADVLSREFEPAPYALSSVLTFCDMTTNPDGEPVPVEKRSPRYQEAQQLAHRIMNLLSLPVSHVMVQLGGQRLQRSAPRSAHARVGALGDPGTAGPGRMPESAEFGAQTAAVLDLLCVSAATYGDQWPRRA